MPTFPFYTTDVFTRERFGGNQLAVFPRAEGIPDEAMPRIAREFNFSETTFVLPPASAAHTRRLRIFTPAAELPFAGHPTVGTAMVLASIGDIPLTGAETRIVLEEGVGPVPVTIRAVNGKPDFAQLTVAKLPTFGPPPPAVEDLARCLGLEAADLLTGEMFPEAASCGVPFLFVPVRNRDALARAVPRADEFARVLRKYWTADVFVFCNEPERVGSHYRARMFAPFLGVAEDPATGSACAAFAGYLGKRDPREDGTLRWIVEQGVEMGRPSLLDVEADKRGGALTSVRVGGSAVMVSKGEFYL